MAKISSIINEIRADNLSIIRVSYEDDFYVDDGYSVYEQALSIAQSSGIYISRNKDLMCVAKNGDEVIGAVWRSVSSDFDEDEQIDQGIYDFDIVISKGYRNDVRIFLGLMKEIFDDYNDVKEQFDSMKFEVTVVNPKLAEVLGKKYGFKVDQKRNDYIIMTRS
jgi:hypothetical protein